LVEAGRIKSVRAQDQVRGGGECCRLHRELHSARGVDQARAGDERITERQRRLLQDLLDSRERQIGVRLQHVGDHAGYAWRRSRGAEKGVEPRDGGVDVVDAGEIATGL